MNKINLSAGVAAFSLALIYILGFAYFGLLWRYPYDGSTSDQMIYLVNHHFSVGSIFFLIYVIFGVVLSPLVLGLYEKNYQRAKQLAQLATLFGVLWVGLVIASGMISVIGLGQVVDLAGVDPNKAAETWRIVSLLTESLGGGNELVGGLWVLLISLCNLFNNIFSRQLNYLGVFVGVAGLATIYPADIFTEIFGIAQIIWFVWLGFAFFRQTNTAK